MSEMTADENEQRQAKIIHDFDAYAITGLNPKDYDKYQKGKLNQLQRKLKK